MSFADEDVVAISGTNGSGTGLRTGVGMGVGMVAVGSA